MRNSQINYLLADDLGHFGLPDLPEEVVDSHRLRMDVSGSIWRFNDPVTNSFFDFENSDIQNPWLLYSLKRHLIYCIRRVSPRESWNIIRLNVLFMSKCDSWDVLCRAQAMEEHAAALNRVMSEVLENLRRDNVLYNFARLRAWFRWCVDYLPDLGFDADEGLLPAA